jgi:hypothetical protein
MWELFSENEIGAAFTGFLNSRCCEATVTFSGSVGQGTRQSFTTALNPH